MVNRLSSLNAKKILVTGNTGFKGSWLTLCLEKLNCDVYGVSLDNHTSLGIYNALNLGGNIKQKYLDISDSSAIYSLIHEIKPEVIFHLAAQPIVAESYINPVKTYLDNAVGTANILHAALDLEETPIIVNVTSDKCYENSESGKPFVESDPLGGRDPYSASKACAEIIAKSFRSSYINKGSENIISVRAGNVIGGGDFADNRIVPDIFRSTQSNGDLTIRKPEAVRPWQHVLDPVGGYLLAASLLIQGERLNAAYNFGPSVDNEKSVQELISSIKKYVNIDNVNVVRTDWEEAKYLKLDSSLAEAELSWLPAFDFDKSIELTSEWYLAQMHNPESLYEITMNQVEQLFLSQSY